MADGVNGRTVCTSVTLLGYLGRKRRGAYRGNACVIRPISNTGIRCIKSRQPNSRRSQPRLHERDGPCTIADCCNRGRAIVGGHRHAIGRYRGGENVKISKI